MKALVLSVNLIKHKIGDKVDGEGFLYGQTKILEFRPEIKSWMIVEVDLEENYPDNFAKFYYKNANVIKLGSFHELIDSLSRIYPDKLVMYAIRLAGKNEKLIGTGNFGRVLAGSKLEIVGAKHSDIYCSHNCKITVDDTSTVRCGNFCEIYAGKSCNIYCGIGCKIHFKTNIFFSAGDDTIIFIEDNSPVKISYLNGFTPNSGYKINENRLEPVRWGY